MIENKGFPSLFVQTGIMTDVLSGTCFGFASSCWPNHPPLLWTTLWTSGVDRLRKRMNAEAGLDCTPIDRQKVLQFQSLATA
jgi:hypothetical protein